MDELIEAIQNNDTARFHAYLGSAPLVFDSITPLMYAAQSGFTEGIPYLDAYLQQRCRASLLYFPLHSTALQIAAFNGNASACLLLLKEAEVSGFSPLTQAVACRNCGVLRSLLYQLKRAQFARKLSRAQRVFGSTGQASQSGVTESTGLVEHEDCKLKAYGGDIFSVFARRDSLGRAFLHYIACWRSQTSEETAQAYLLLEAAAALNLLDACDSLGKNCLHVAAIWGNAWFCRQILQICPRLLGSACAGGTTALMIAASRGHAAAVRLLLQESDLRDESGWRAIDYAREQNCAEVLQMLAARQPSADSQLRSATARPSETDSSIPSPPPCAHVAISPTIDPPHSADTKPLDAELGFQTHAIAYPDASQASEMRRSAEYQHMPSDYANYHEKFGPASQQPAPAAYDPEKQNAAIAAQQTLRDYAFASKSSLPLTDSLEISAVDQTAEMTLAISRLTQDNSNLQKQVQDVKNELAEVIQQYEEKITRLTQLFEKHANQEEEMANLIPHLVQ